MQFKEVTMFEAPDGSRYATREECEAYDLQKSIDTVGAVSAAELKQAVMSPASAPQVLLDAIAALHELFTQHALSVSVPGAVQAHEEHVYHHEE